MCTHVDNYIEQQRKHFYIRTVVLCLACFSPVRSDVRHSSRQPTASGRAIMCAYKLCKVEFRYWGMQSKIER